MAESKRKHDTIGDPEPSQAHDKHKRQKKHDPDGPAPPSLAPTHGSWEPGQAAKDALLATHDSLRVALSKANVASLIGLCGEDIATKCAELKLLLKPFAAQISATKYAEAPDESRRAEPSMSSLILFKGQTLPPLPVITDPKLRLQAITHSSVADVQNQSNRVELSYERLEHLGDAYLQMIATKVLFEKFPRATDGALSRLRQNLVCNATLAMFTRAYKLDEQLIMKPDQKPLLGRDGFTKICGDLFEAHIGAIMVSSPQEGEKILEAWLRKLWTKQIISGAGDSTVPPQENEDAAKIQLAKLIMGVRIKVRYQQERPPKEDRSKGQSTFYMEIRLDGWGYQNQFLGKGEGISKRSASARAAAAALRNHPLIDTIAAKKREFDEATRIQREAETKAGSESSQKKEHTSSSDSEEDSKH